MQSKFNKLPKQSAPVIRPTISTAATDGNGVEASFAWSSLLPIAKNVGSALLGAL